MSDGIHCDHEHFDRHCRGLRRRRGTTPFTVRPVGPACKENRRHACSGITSSRASERHRERVGESEGEPLGRLECPREDHPHPGLPRRTAAARNDLQMVRRQVRHRLRQHHRARRNGRRAGRPRRSLSARPVLPAGLCRGRARRPARARAAPARRRSAAARQAQSPDGRRAEGASLREERHRHRLLGHPRPGRRPAGVRAARRPLRRGRPPLPRHLAGIARRDGGARRRLSRRRLPPLPAQSRRRSRRRHRAHPRRRREARSPAIGSSPTPTPAGRSTRRCASSKACATWTSTSSSRA